MSSGSCGTNTKKQKLHHHHQASLDVNGGSGSASTALPDGVKKITTPAMGYFCFDTLYSYLNSLEPPKKPDFTNDPL